MAGGFTDEGLAALDAALARHASRGAVPGLVALVARGGEVHVTTAGHLAAGDPGPIGRDAIFRIASLTKPVIGATAMLLIQEGAMALDDPVERWLPELSGRRVLRCYDAELSDTVPAARPVTVEDVLSFRFGFGCIFTPQALPIIEAEAELGLKTLGPPWPPTPLTPDEWIAGLGRLPLLDQPGERWRYNTGATVAGVLIERVAGAPLAEVLSKRLFEPLGMPDTAFHVPAAKRSRFTSMYAPAAAASFVGASADDADDAGLVLVDRTGKTIYSPEQEAHGKILCTGSCLGFWFPVSVASGTRPHATAGLSGTFGTIRRTDDGVTQLTYNGRPLYTFRLDQGPGELHGNNFSDQFGGRSFTWQVVGANGSVPSASQSAKPSGGYSYPASGAYGN